MHKSEHPLPAPGAQDKYTDEKKEILSLRQALLVDIFSRKEAVSGFILQKFPY